ncbi:MAG: hypothetical protein ACFFBD_15200 [Candidatus Hodarchaeota archaeon]
MKIGKWGLFEISRESVKFSHIYGIADDPELLTKVLPFGQPLGVSVKYVAVNEVIYFSYLKMNEEEGRGIVFAFDQEEKIPDNYLGFLPKMMTFLDSPPPKASLEIEPQEIQAEPIQIRDFEIAIFSILGGLRTIILGEEGDIMKIISAICLTTPYQMKTRLRFVSQSTSLSENVNIIGMPFSEEVLSELDGSKGKYTILILGDRVYGQYSSKICKTTANLAKKGDFGSIKTLLEEFVQIAVESGDLPPALDFANQTGLHLSDAQLALIIRAGVFGKKVPNGILDVGN